MRRASSRRVQRACGSSKNACASDLASCGVSAAVARRTDCASAAAAAMSCIGRDSNLHARMARKDTKRRFSKAVTVKFLNRVLRPLLERGLFPRTHALLETTGRKSGQPRRVPVGNGLRGDQFWIVTEHGNSADYVKNVRNDPHVRVKVGRTWRTGTPH